MTAMLYPYTHLSEEELIWRVSKMTGPATHGGHGPVCGRACSTAGTARGGRWSAAPTVSTSSRTTAPSGTFNATACSRSNGKA